MAWWQTARPGDKVVCVVRDWHGDDEAPDPVFNVIYTIREVRPDEDFVWSGCALFFEEFPVFAGFCASGFRPVAKRSSESGVAALRRHLHGLPVSERLTTPDFRNMPEEV